MATKNYVLILSSGGIDSTACIRFFKKSDFIVEAIFFDYGQLSKAGERQAVFAIADYYKVTIRTAKISMDRKMKGGLIQGRNAVFYMTALMNFQAENGIIASGIHSGTPYYDCSQAFLTDIQRLFDGYANGTVKAVAPFLNFTKADIFNYCLAEKLPLHLTYSCELGRKQPCGHCDTCKDLEKIYVISNHQN